MPTKLPIVYTTMTKAILIFWSEMIPLVKMNISSEELSLNSALFSVRINRYAYRHPHTIIQLQRCCSCELQVFTVVAVVYPISEKIVLPYFTLCYFNHRQ